MGYSGVNKITLNSTQNQSEPQVNHREMNIEYITLFQPFFGLLLLYFFLIEASKLTFETNLLPCT